MRPLAPEGKGRLADPDRTWLPRLYRRWAALTFALPFLLLLAVEGVLRLLGWGGYPPFLRVSGQMPTGEEVCLVEPAASKPYFFANPDRPGYAEQTNFLRPKPPGTVRIFLFGESAAKGYPQPRNLAMSAFLEAMLEDCWPGRPVEVINLGTTAVASFPIVYMVQDALAFEPDLVIFYTGNNEFYGTYGTVSLNALGGLPPSVARGLRAVRGLAIVQALGNWLNTGRVENRTLMEEMIGRAVVDTDSPLRAAAARNLRENLTTMLTMAKAAGIPAVVCTTAANESGLAPLGKDDTGSLDAAELAQLDSLLERARAQGSPTQALTAAQAAVQLAPRHALAQYLLGRAWLAQGARTEAREAFLAARDLDTMPWRPTAATEQAIREAAANSGAILCDVAEAFRAASPEGAAGWALVDDHVHLSVQGQARAAKAMVEAMSELTPPLQVEPGTAAGLPDWTSYAQRLGTNDYDAYRVNHTLRVLFGLSFMRRNNADALARVEAACQAAERRMSPSVLQEARRWQTMKPHAGGLRPLLGMVARTQLAEGHPEKALPLYERAQQQVPDYTSWYLEYVYFALACREKIQGALSEADRAEAARAIAQGQFLLRHGDSSTGLTERYVGRLHQLRAEWAEAIPYLLAARMKLTAEDRVACDQALVLSYVRTGQTPQAQALLDEGIRDSGRFSGIYQRLKQGLLAEP